MVSKFYSEGDFFLKDAQHTSPLATNNFNGELRVTPI